MSQQKELPSRMAEAFDPIDFRSYYRRRNPRRVWGHSGSRQHTDFESVPTVLLEPHRNGQRSTPLVIPTNEEKTANRNRLIVMLSKPTIVNPDTGYPYTNDEIAAAFNLTGRVVTRIINHEGSYGVKLPEVKKGPVPSSEQAFFMGLLQADYSMEQVNWDSARFICVSTEAINEGKRSALKSAGDKWGEVHSRRQPHSHGRSDRLVAYLDADSFSFLHNTKLNAKYFDARSRFAPFMLGFIAAKITDRSRISHPNIKLLTMMNEGFEDFFGVRLGNIKTEKRKRPDGNVDIFHAVYLNDMAAIVGALFSEPSVKSLSFFQDFKSTFIARAQST